MRHQKILVVDDDPASLETIASTLTDARQPWLAVDSHQAGWNALQTHTDISLVLLRAFGKQISGLELCRQIRQQASATGLSVIMILRESELTDGAETLLVGASDLLVDPFDADELRLRANLQTTDAQRRKDHAHVTAIDNPDSIAPPEVFLPEFDAHTKQINFGVFEGRLNGWDKDPDVTRIALDKIIVCPKCNGIPTVRPGCGSCGSAWMDAQVMIHHYACAHVAPEADFLTPAGLVCPKCRLRNLAAGADFEQIQGCLKCADCAEVFARPRLIGHCLHCEHRFPVSEGKLKSIYAYEVGRAPDAATIPRPAYTQHDRPAPAAHPQVDEPQVNKSAEDCEADVSAGAVAEC